MASGRIYVVRSRRLEEKENLPTNPGLAKEFFQAARIQGILLRQAKAGLDALQPDAKDRLLRALHHPGRTVVRHMATQTRAQAMSNAWLKGYELYDFFDIHVLAAKGVFFNAELPGSFLAALNHWLAERDRGMIPWLASSLHPATDQTALTDIYGLWQGNPDNWIMTPENTGDLRKLCGVRSIIQIVKSRGLSVDLYISDAGMEFADDQEAAASKMHLGQVLCCMRLLNVGGMAIMKFYTYFHPWTYTMIAFLADFCFTSSYIVKPVMSRITNSEVYFVGTGYLGCPMDTFMGRMIGAFYNESLPINLHLHVLEVNLLQYETLKALYCIMIEIFGQQQKHLTNVIQAGPYLTHIRRAVPKVTWTRCGPRPIDQRLYLPQQEVSPPCSQQACHTLLFEEAPISPTTPEPSC